MSEDDEMRTQIKVIVLGSVGVGKTSLITRYKSGKFLKNIPSTIGSTFVKIDKIFNKKKYTLNIWDTAGQERYQSLAQTYLKNAQIILLVYSITNKKSFEDLNTWLDLIRDKNGKDGYSLGIAANKSDLYDEMEVNNKKGEEFARKAKAIWKLTSAKADNGGINELMEELLKNYIELEERFSNINTNDTTIKLDNTVFSERKKGGCCKSNKNEKINKNNIRTSVRSNYSANNKTGNDDKDLSLSLY